MTLSLKQTGFNRLMLVLLRHQSFVDALVCLLASVVVVQPFMWTTGLNWLDQFICHVWHSQALYWGAVTLSTYNLVCIAIERYIAVARPFQYSDLMEANNKKKACIFLVLYAGMLFITHGTYLQTRLQDGKCLNEYFMDGPAVQSYFFGFVIFTYILTYFVPALAMAILYSIIVCKLQRRKKNLSLGQSTVIDRASTQLTKTAAIVTLIFIVTIGYDLHYYLLGYSGITSYDLNSPVQKIGVFLSNLNSCTNPFVYALLMPQYRQNIWDSCKRCCGFKLGSSLPNIESVTRI